jgi:hypothetical protein
MDEPFIIPIVLFACIFTTAIVGILARTFATVVCHWRDVSLKMRMVDAGFSPADIEQVIRTGGIDNVHSRPAKPAPIAGKPGFAR